MSKKSIKKRPIVRHTGQGTTMMNSVFVKHPLLRTSAAAEWGKVTPGLVEFNLAGTRFYLERGAASEFTAALRRLADSVDRLMENRGTGS